MAAVHGRRLALSVATLAILLVGILVAVFHREIHERWWLWRLDSGDPAVRIEAAEALAGLGSLRAVPRIVELIAAEAREQVVARYRNGQPTDLYLTPLYHALFRLGPAVESIVARPTDRSSADEGAAEPTVVEKNLAVMASFRGEEQRPKVQRVEYGFQLPQVRQRITF